MGTSRSSASASELPTDARGPEARSGPVVPPYWAQHARQASRASLISNGGKPPPITLEDNSAEPDLDAAPSPLWARAVAVDDHAVISGSVAGVGDYVVWICRVQTLDGTDIVIRKRYSEFEALRDRLVSTFPSSSSSLPPLPPKSIIYKFRPSFLEKRRRGLEYFLNCILLNPEFASSPVLKDFIFEA